jgi:sulfatase modifying factor 1
MRKILAIATLVCSTCICLHAQQKKLPKELRNVLDEMQFIEGGTYTMGQIPGYLTATERDSTLLLHTTPRRVTVGSFLISDHEVTNNEYREFTQWVRDSIAREYLAKLDRSYYHDGTTNLDWEMELDWSNKDLIDQFYLSANERFNATSVYDIRKLKYRNQEGSEHEPQITHIYPDTTCWSRDFKYSFNEPLTNLYYWHPAYDNYPLTGVSWEQARAFCDWKSHQLRKIASRNGMRLANYRLPTEAEWEYAAYGLRGATEDDVINERRLYPWNGRTLRGVKQGFMANFGAIVDRNGLTIKDMSDDGFFHTGPVKTMKPNDFGLYHMAGNVAEWIEDVHRIQTMDHLFQPNENPWHPSPYGIDDDDNVDSVRVKLQRRTIEKSGRELSDEKLQELAEEIFRDKTVTEAMDSPRIVKGGSWADGPSYILCGTREAFSQKQSSSRIGFRVAMVLTQEMLPYFETKK